MIHCWALKDHFAKKEGYFSCIKMLEKLECIGLLNIPSHIELRVKYEWQPTAFITALRDAFCLFVPVIMLNCIICVIPIVKLVVGLDSSQPLNGHHSCKYG